MKTVKVKSWKVKQGRLSVRGASQSANCQEGKLSDIDKTLLRNLSLECCSQLGRLTILAREPRELCLGLGAKLNGQRRCGVPHEHTDTILDLRAGGGFTISTGQEILRKQSCGTTAKFLENFGYR